MDFAFILLMMAIGAVVCNWVNIGVVALRACRVRGGRFGYFDVVAEVSGGGCSFFTFIEGGGGRGEVIGGEGASASAGGGGNMSGISSFWGTDAGGPGNEGGGGSGGGGILAINSKPRDVCNTLTLLNVFRIYYILLSRGRLTFR